MKKVIVVILLLVCVGGYASETASQHLIALLSKTKTFQANFTQTTEDNSKAIQHSKGIMQLQKPHLFRWETFEPTHQIVILNQSLMIYDVDLQQATIQSVNHLSTMPVTLLSGNTAYLNNFSIQAKSANDKTVFTLTPKTKDLPFNQITIAFSHDVLSSLSVINNLDQTNTFQFSNIKTNIIFNAQLFSLHLPKDVEVIHE